ncbi:flagellar biosynthetic protein FliO [Billgrantia gudaonensis]|uniref:Flagellar protein n=1 Tax=Billgrantia gudaonensis TaxID=376427 RepID=A0A1G8T2I1_9GAMM|nr:flagellar biosynthetic protein FliO [Halomonas gudaonensis]SDJ35577.1 flagellar protein FliO/FliZ [Halomonas gudaonensis]
MSDTPATEASASGLDALASSGDSLVGMATLGKTAAALALVIAIILVCTALLRRWGGHSRGIGRHLRVVASTTLGGRERLVIVEIEDTWLVLGVGGGQVTKLHEMPVPASGTTKPAASDTDDSRFATRFARALRHNTGLGGSGRRES